MTPSFPPSHDIAETLAASARYLLGDVHHIMAQGRLEYPDLFEGISYDALVDFIGRVREGFTSHPAEGRTYHLPTSAPSRQDAAIGRQILRRLACWPVGREMEVAAWELALSHFLAEAPAIRRRA